MTHRHSPLSKRHDMSQEWVVTHMTHRHSLLNKRHDMNQEWVVTRRWCLRGCLSCWGGRWHSKRSRGHGRGTSTSRCCLRGHSSRGRSRSLGQHRGHTWHHRGDRLGTQHGGDTGCWGCTGDWDWHHWDWRWAGVGGQWRGRVGWGAGGNAAGHLWLVEEEVGGSCCLSLGFGRSTPARCHCCTGC